MSSSAVLDFQTLNREAGDPPPANSRNSSLENDDLDAILTNFNSNLTVEKEMSLLRDSSIFALDTNKVIKKGLSREPSISTFLDNGGADPGLNRQHSFFPENLWQQNNEDSSSFVSFTSSSDIRPIGEGDFAPQHPLFNNLKTRAVSNKISRPAENERSGSSKRRKTKVKTKIATKTRQVSRPRTPQKISSASSLRQESAPIPTDVSTSTDFNKKVLECLRNDGHKICTQLSATNTTECKYCDPGTKKKNCPTFMTTKQYKHEDRRCEKNPEKYDTRGLQLKFSKFNNFSHRICEQRKRSLDVLVKYVQGRAGYKHHKTGLSLLEEISEANVLLAKSRLVYYGYTSNQYEEWSKTWPVKAAASPSGSLGKGNVRSEPLDEMVAGYVRDFFELGSKEARQVERLPSTELPKVLNKIYKHASLLGLEVPKDAIHCASKFDRPDANLQEEFIQLSLADLYRQTGQLEKAKLKTMSVLSLLGTGKAAMSDGEKELLDYARKLIFFECYFFFIFIWKETFASFDAQHLFD
jgi:hypothetical protein